jgi:sulfatase maturation enzyme AslB (radical SAM superfamily)
LESIYFVITWLCHRTCRHCYEPRFQPYYGDQLKQVVDQSRSNVGRIIDNLPESMSYLDRNDPDPCGGLRRKRGRIIVAGGEVMLEPVREPVLYPALDQLHDRYKGGVELIVQTTGDILTERMAAGLLEHHTSVISISGLDEYHDGLEPEAARDRMQERLTQIFQTLGMKESPGAGARENERYYHFFGAAPDSWIGKLWPRGRAFANELSTATLEDNFCNRWSGGLKFLEREYNGSEVSIDPEGNVFPCCIKTKLPLGNLLHARLDDILDSLRGNPVYEAISAGHPERMGLEHGWSVEKFLEKSRTALGSGRSYQNLCIGCDAFHEELLSPLVQISAT